MRKSLSLFALVLAVGCNKDKAKEAPPATATGSAAPAADVPAQAPAPAPAPAAPAPEPVKMTKEELNPKCAKLFPADVAAKAFAGATEVKEETAKGPLAICQFMKGEESRGSVTIACNPDLDPTAIERERGAMTKAVDLAAPVGRGGYRISNSFVLIDDETPCRIMANFMTLPEGAAETDALRAIIGAVNPGALK
jgi:hypothetical protein